MEGYLELAEQQLAALYGSKRRLQRALQTLENGVRTDQTLLVPFGKAALIPAKVASDKVLCSISSEYLAEMSQSCAKKKV